ncbi:hypothetical protein [Streptomyces sp. NPDC058623]|uniref:hypothetical protein n=1 Tax=Streptomyces sp. NPDC058623 TaxID=3346563 RepID=UPI003655B8E9
MNRRPAPPGRWCPPGRPAPFDRPSSGSRPYPSDRPALVGRWFPSCGSSRSGRPAVVALALTGPLLLTACGIAPTGVIESGAPARVAVAAPARGPLAFFVGPDGRLVPSPQPRTAASAPLSGVLGLLRGPGSTELRAGLGTRLPVVEGPDAAAVAVVPVADDGLDLRVPFPVAGLDAVARGQLVCSAAAGLGNGYEVFLHGPDTTLDPERCHPDH